MQCRSPAAGRHGIPRACVFRELLFEFSKCGTQAELPRTKDARDKLDFAFADFRLGERDFHAAPMVLNAAAALAGAGAAAAAAPRGVVSRLWFHRNSGPIS